jgi:hypothetical protein
MGSLNPWKVQCADVDGDGGLDISIGAYKTTPFHPVYAKRPFIYDFNGSLEPKWLGSRLSKPFEDYVFEDIDSDGMDEIISSEILSNGKMLLNAYKWKGFGFEAMGCSGEYESISGIKTYRNYGSAGDKVFARFISDGKWRDAAFAFDTNHMNFEEIKHDGNIVLNMDSKYY